MPRKKKTEESPKPKIMEVESSLDDYEEDVKTKQTACRAVLDY